MIRQGLFITFEGPEGCGKSTQAGRLEARLKGHGVPVVRTREPGGTTLGETIRGILQHDDAGEDLCPEAEVVLFEASRAQLVRRVIAPALEQGACVVCDRFADSTTVYQGYGRGFSLETIQTLNAFATAGVIPDVTFLIDVEIEEGFARLARRNEETNTGPDRLEQEARAFHEKVRRGYLDLAEREKDRFVVLDGCRDADAVEADVWSVIRQRLESMGKL